MEKEGKSPEVSVCLICVGDPGFATTLREVVWLSSQGQPHPAVISHTVSGLLRSLASCLL